ncbi:MerR family DNA-binding transcriptional regulator [Sphingobacterium sp. UBA5996]|uniref:MerR family DNA-binding transcriptional regulator n=1 Tax=Sphingobacterium sp. UBA5996 TaxID=1947505 RepID=UPI0025F04823|nr:MerR family DNA-binding transcriptional regulator [Sphingobacterium sp. UBA5996]
MSKSDNNKDLSFEFNFLDKLVVGIGEVAQITGIPTRQIHYWEEKVIIQSLTEEEGKTR